MKRRSLLGSLGPLEFMMISADERNDLPDSDFADVKNRKYLIDTHDHTKAAWSYINMPKNAAKYTEEELKVIKNRIKKAAKKFGIEIKEEEGSKEELSGSLEKLKESTDVVHLSVPLAIRIMEFSREDARNDEDLHFTMERLVELCQGGNVATMDDYYKITDTVEKSDK